MKEQAGWWSRHFLLAESCLALMIAGLLVIWSECWGGRSVLMAVLDDNRAAIYGALISLYGALLGFVIATAAIVLGLITSDRFAVLRASSHYTTLWKVFTSSAWVLGLAAMCSLAGLLLDRDKNPIMIVFYIGMSSSLVASFRLARCIWALDAIIGIAVSEGTSSRK